MVVLSELRLKDFFYMGVMIFRVFDINLCYWILVGALNDCKHEVNLIIMLKSHSIF